MLDLVSYLTGRIRTSTGEMAASAAIYGIVAVLTLTAYSALLFAIFLSISAEFGPVMAALSIAGITLAGAVVALLVLHLRRRRRPVPMRAASPLSAGSGAAVNMILPMMLRASPVGSLVAVAALVYVLSKAGQRPERDF